MSTLTSAGIALPTPSVEAAPRRRRNKPRAVVIEQALTFTVAGGAFLALGLWVTLRLHVIYPDAESRFTHAYMVWWNQPGKLAAIGFVWPPLQTLSLLPFTLFKPLATTLVALPLFSAVCGGALMAVLGRTLTVIGVGRWWRYALLVAFAANPLLADYASNGMAEILNVLLLALGVHYFVVWYLTEGRSNRSLLASGVWLSLGFMSRYELAAWTVAICVVVVLEGRIRRHRYIQIEAPLLLFLAPTMYITIIWAGISASVIGGGPLGWLSRASGQGQGQTLAVHDPVHVAIDVFKVTGRISPLVWVVPALLVVLAVLRRDRFALILSVMVLLGAATTFLLVVHSPHTGLLQLRYNFRALPVALVGGGWAIARVSKRLRPVVGAVVLLSLIAAVPLAYRAMEHYPYQFEEQAWARGVSTGQSQNGMHSVGGFTVGDLGDEQMANWINTHVTTPKSILIDDATDPGVLLQSGRPDLFVDRVDHGDAKWKLILRHPWGRVRYLLVGYHNAGFTYDLISDQYPGVTTGALPGSRVVYRTSSSVLVELAPREPIAPLPQGPALSRQPVKGSLSR